MKDMANIEKVITGLELCTEITQDGCLMLCPYKDEQDETYSGFCEQVLKHDALQLLREYKEIINSDKTASLNTEAYDCWPYDSSYCAMCSGKETCETLKRYNESENK